MSSKAGRCNTCLPTILSVENAGPVNIDWIRLYVGIDDQANEYLHSEYPDVTPYVTQRYKYEFTGSALSTLDGWKVLRESLSLGRVSRVDYAIDASITLDFDHLYNALSTRHKNVYRIQNNQGGYTICVGKRASQRFFRVYDKRQEMIDKTGIDVGCPWVRFELETKKEAVTSYAQVALVNHNAIKGDVENRYGISLGDGDGLSIDVAKREAGDEFSFVERYKAVIASAFHNDPQRFIDIMERAR